MFYGDAILYAVSIVGTEICRKLKGVRHRRQQKVNEVYRIRATALDQCT